MLIWLTRCFETRKRGLSARRRWLQVERLEERWTPSAPTYSSYLGGDNSDEVTSVATDSAGYLYVAGRTNSDTFPGISGNLPLFANGFVSKFDPTGTTLLWTTLIDSDTDGVRGIAVDGSDNVYVTGSTGLTSGFATAGATQARYGGNGDAFAAKLNGGTGSILWATYIGGEQLDNGLAITVDKGGDSYVTGYTTSTLFPTHNPLSGQGSLLANSGLDVFVTELNPSGSQFLFSSYLGGNQNGPNENGATKSEAHAITMDSTGNIYLTGYTEAADFPTVNPFQAVKGQGLSVFVTEIGAGGSGILYSTYLGGKGPGDDLNIGNGIAVDRGGNIVVVGDTDGVHFPLKYPFDPRVNHSGIGGNDDAFVTRLNPHAAGSAQLVYSTYIGGSAIDFANAVAVDQAGNAYVTGTTGSELNYPLVNPFQRFPSGAFIAELTPAGRVLLNSYYGGGGEVGNAIAVCPFGKVIFAGNTPSTRLPTTANAFQRTFPDATDSGFVAMLNGTPNKVFHGLDSDGDLYTVWLSGPGSVSVVQKDQGSGTGPLAAIYLSGTSSLTSTLSITVTKKVGDGFVDVGSITGPGLLRIAAATANLVGGGIQLTGRLGSLAIHDLNHGASIQAADLGTQSTSIQAHVIGDGSAINVGGNLSLLRAATIGTASILAPHVTTLSITGDKVNGISGDLSARLMLTGTGIALGTATVAGSVSHADIEVQAGNVTTFRAGAFFDSTLFLGANGGLIAGQRLGTFSVSGFAGSSTPAFVNSNVAASIIGVVSLASVQTSNGGTKFGIEGHQSIGQVKVFNPMFSYNAKNASPQGVGEFEVQLI
jgi:hypothetical protein